MEGWWRGKEEGEGGASNEGVVAGQRRGGREGSNGGVVEGEH